MSTQFLADLDKETRSIIGGEFAETASFTFPFTFDIEGIFDETYLEVDPETGVEVMSSNPRLTVAQSELEELAGQEIEQDPADAWELIVRGSKYFVKRPMADGTGMLVLDLMSIPATVLEYEGGGVLEYEGGGVLQFE